MAFPCKQHPVDRIEHAINCMSTSRYLKIDVCYSIKTTLLQDCWVSHLSFRECIMLNSPSGVLSLQENLFTSLKSTEGVKALIDNRHRTTRDHVDNQWSNIIS